ncbi:hypothetical protein [Sutterella wadsworthensis]|uniref:hypothetical protein n=1 Tax=Sutterella wadsworthensis TaxID=40545 RepID=UPI00396777D8
MLYLKWLALIPVSFIMAVVGRLGVGHLQTTGCVASPERLLRLRYLGARAED